MRTLELLKPLSQKELKRIELQVVDRARKNMLPLFKELKKCVARNQEPDRPELFKKIFSRKYTKGEDYLLRNELRLLNEIIYEFLALDCVKEHMSKNRSLFNRWLAQSYFNRRMLWFAGDIDEFLDEAKKNLQMEEVTLLCALRAAWSGLFIRQPNENAPGELKDWLEQEKLRFLHRLRKIEYSLAFFDESRVTEKPLSLPKNADWSKPGLMQVDLEELDKSDWYTRYLTLQKYFMQSQGEPQLKYLEEIISLTGADRAQHVIKPDSHIKNLESLAFVHFTNGSYEKAQEYMEAPIIEGKKRNVPVSPSHAIIRLANLFKIGMPDKAIAAYEQYKKIIDKSAVHGKAMMIVSFCHIYQNRPDEALRIFSGTNIPVEINFQSRYVYLIAFLLRRQYDLAMNELKNLKRLLTKPDSDTTEIDATVAGYFQIYISHLSKGNPASSKPFIKLKSDLLKEASSRKGSPFNNLELDWLIRQVKPL